MFPRRITSLCGSNSLAISMRRKSQMVPRKGIWGLVEQDPSKHVAQAEDGGCFQGCSEMSHTSVPDTSQGKGIPVLH